LFWLQSHTIYRRHHQVDNPNTKLIQILKRSGLDLFICGQAPAGKELSPALVNPTQTLSALPLIYQLDGYALLNRILRHTENYFVDMQDFVQPRLIAGLEAIMPAMLCLPATCHLNIR
jgi:hypothetical protein